MVIFILHLIFLFFRFPYLFFLRFFYIFYSFVLCYFYTIFSVLFFLVFILVYCCDYFLYFCIVFCWITLRDSRITNCFNDAPGAFSKLMSGSTVLNALFRDLTTLSLLHGIFSTRFSSNLPYLCCISVLLTCFLVFFNRQIMN